MATIIVGLGINIRNNINHQINIYTTELKYIQNTSKFIRKTGKLMI